MAGVAVATSRPAPLGATGLAALAEALLWNVERRRQQATVRLAQGDRATLGQFLSPPPVAAAMAALLPPLPESVQILDPGCGVGSLFATVVSLLLRQQPQVRRVRCDAYELDPLLAVAAQEALTGCGELCAAAGVAWESRLVVGDYLATAVPAGAEPLPLEETLPAPRYDLVVTNPPYRKIGVTSAERQVLQRAGWVVSNLYAGFLGLAASQLASGGNLLAICPRSFCNGRYFREFRRRFLSLLALRRVHLFEERDAAFRDGEVLQECLIFRAERGPAAATVAIVAASADAATASWQDVPYEVLVPPADPDQVLHLPLSGADARLAQRLSDLEGRFERLGLGVATGRLVEFRARPDLRPVWRPGDLPVVHPLHLRQSQVSWPQPGGRRPEGLRATPATAALAVPNGCYVLVKRFTAKEQPRRVVAAVHDPAAVPGSAVVFENHLNVVHARTAPLDAALAQGLCAWLNSTAVDTWFRVFSGSTQVNATDLRRLPLPSAALLRRFGADPRWCGDQQAVDALCEEEVAVLTDDDLTAVPGRVAEATAALQACGLPSRLCNKMAAVTLLAYLDLGPRQPWSAATAPLRGIDQVIGFAADRYDVRYQTGTRESIRKQAVQPFLQAGLLLKNPDDPQRAVNSPATVYQLEPGALALLRTFGTGQWEGGLRVYRATMATLAGRYAAERAMPQVPVRTPDGQRFALTAGEHSELIREVVEQFAVRFTPGAEVLYVGDAGAKWVFHPPAAEQRLADLGVTLDPHGQMPDVLLYDASRQWLVLVEAVTSHGPVDAKRKAQLQSLFGGAKVGLIFVTAFLRREDLLQYLRTISWETEVWLADAPSHLIHFDGDRFLGPPPESSPA